MQYVVKPVVRVPHVQIIARHCMCVCLPAEAMVFLWAQLAPQLAQLAGNCSYFISAANAFGGNHADIAGAVIFSSNVSSMQLSCNADEGSHEPSMDCSDWSSSGSNSSGGSSSSSSYLAVNTVGAGGIPGYGPGLAFPPAEVIFTTSGNSSMRTDYISDGSTNVPIPAVQVLDQAGTKVIAQPLRANVTVATVVSHGSALPQLPGQTEALADATGNISIKDLVLIADPGVYNLMVALPDFPQVKAHHAQWSIMRLFGRGVHCVQDLRCIGCLTGPSQSVKY